MIINKINTQLSTIVLISSLFLSVRCTQKIVSTEERFSDLQNKNNAYPETDSSFYNEGVIRYEDKIYKSSIHTVLLHPKGWELSDPVILLNSEEILNLQFDELDSDIKTYQYKIIHCNKDWSKSNLSGLDYINGFQENYIDNYKYSYSTLQSYVHYSTEFPNENIQLIKSGNYIVMVYEENNEEEPIITKRFYVSENSIQIKPRIKYPSDLDNKYYQQEVDFTLLYNKGIIINPFSTISVFIEQNHRSDNSITDLKPNFAKENELVYDYDEENVFNGGNEFRHIDLSNLKIETDRVRQMENTNQSHTIWIKPDIKRTYKKYLETGDANGRFVIKNINGNNHELESDYVNTIFSLPFPEPLSKGDLYIYGQLTDWKINDKFRLQYNYEELAYKATSYLKQGYYNYNYIYISDTTTKGDISFIEGTHFDTENDYIFKVYYSDPSGFYDRLLLYYIANSRKDF